MSTSSGAGSGTSSRESPKLREFVVKRDNERPLSFEGVQLAHAKDQSMMTGMDVLEAAIYRTRGGKFITTLSKTAMLADILGAERPGAGYSKAAVHESFEAAMGWFRPGRLTDEIRQQLGLNEPERID
jgi:hypothetical protein